MDTNEHRMTEKDSSWEERFWEDPEKVMRLIDLLFLGKEEGEFRIPS